MKDLIEALTIFSKYAPDCKYPTHCEHDVLSISSDVDVNDVSEEDIKRLAELGFVHYDEHDGFISYRFGSC